MFDFMHGILKNKEPTKAIIEVGGIGYRLVIPLNTYTRLPALESPTHLFLSQVIREDAHTLYAFIDQEERNLFEVLITLTGIGPKTAIGIIGHLDMNGLRHAILTNDIRILSKLPGIGKKTAERLVLEMKDKIQTLHKKETGSPLSPSSSDHLIVDAISALMNLGYSPIESQKAVQSARKEALQETDLGRLISLSLKKI